MKLCPVFTVGAANYELGRANRRLVALALTIAFHAVWLLALLDRAADPRHPLNESHSEVTITLLPIDRSEVDKSSSDDPAPRPNSATQAASQDANPSPVELATTAAETPAEPVDMPATTTTATPQPEQVATAGEVYDPYAGTAPMRRSDPVAPLLAIRATSTAQQLPPPSAASRLFELDAGAFEAFKRRIKEDLGATKGTVDLRVRVSRSGTVVGAALLSSDLPTVDAQKAVTMVTGQALFIVLDPGATEATVDLPSIKLRRGWHLFE